MKIILIWAVIIFAWWMIVSAPDSNATTDGNTDDCYGWSCSEGSTGSSLPSTSPWGRDRLPTEKWMSEDRMGGRIG